MSCWGVCPLDNWLSFSFGLQGLQELVDGGVFLGEVLQQLQVFLDEGSGHFGCVGDFTDAQAPAMTQQDLFEGPDVPMDGLGAVVGFSHGLFDGLAFQKQLPNDLNLMSDGGPDVVHRSATREKSPMFILVLADICGDRCVADLQEDANLRIRQATVLTPCLLKQSYDGLSLQFAEPFSLGTLAGVLGTHQI